MLYRIGKSFKHHGKWTSPNNLIELDDDKEIEMLKEAKAIIDVERKIETAMKGPKIETRQTKTRKRRTKRKK